MKKLQEIRDLVQEAIDNGARTVDQIHKSLGNRPLEMLNKIDLPGFAMDRLGDLRKLKISDVSDFMETMNQRVSEIAGELLRKVKELREPHNMIYSPKTMRCYNQKRKSVQK